MSTRFRCLIGGLSVLAGVVCMDARAQEEWVRSIGVEATHYYEVTRVLPNAHGDAYWVTYVPDPVRSLQHVAMRAADGALLRTDPIAGGYGPREYAAFGDDRTAYVLRTETLAAESHDGTTRWSVPVPFCYGGSIAVGRTGLVFAKCGTALSAYDAAAGALRWSRTLTGQTSDRLATDAGGGVFVVQSGHQTTHIDQDGGVTPLEDPVAVLADNGRAVETGDGEYAALFGRSLQRITLSGIVDSIPLDASDRLVSASAAPDGTLFALISRDCVGCREALLLRWPRGASVSYTPIDIGESIQQPAGVRTIRRVVVDSSGRAYVAGTVALAERTAPNVFVAAFDADGAERWRHVPAGAADLFALRAADDGVRVWHGNDFSWSEGRMEHLGRDGAVLDAHSHGVAYAEAQAETFGSMRLDDSTLFVAGSAHRSLSFFDRLGVFAGYGIDGQQKFVTLLPATRSATTLFSRAAGDGSSYVVGSVSEDVGVDADATQVSLVDAAGNVVWSHELGADDGFVEYPNDAVVEPTSGDLLLYAGRQTSPLQLIVYRIRRDGSLAWKTTAVTGDEQSTAGLVLGADGVLVAYAIRFMPENFHACILTGVRISDGQPVWQFEPHSNGAYERCTGAYRGPDGRARTLVHQRRSGHDVAALLSINSDGTTERHADVRLPARSAFPTSAPTSSGELLLLAWPTAATPQTRVIGIGVEGLSRSVALKGFPSQYASGHPRMQWTDGRIAVVILEDTGTFDSRRSRLNTFLLGDGSNSVIARRGEEMAVLHDDPLALRFDGTRMYVAMNRSLHTSAPKRLELSAALYPTFFDGFE